MTKIAGVEVQDLESLNLVNLTNDKQELLDEYDKDISKDKNLSGKNLFYTYLALITLVTLFVPKIIIANTVYKKSLSIQKKERELEFLRTQKLDLKVDLQGRKFRSDILK